MEGNRPRLRGEVDRGEGAGMSNPPRLLIEPGKVALSGEWTLAALLPELSQLRSRLVVGEVIAVDNEEGALGVRFHV